MDTSDGSESADVESFENVDLAEIDLKREAGDESLSPAERRARLVAIAKASDPPRLSSEQRIAEDRERIRGQLARGLLVLFAAVVFVVLILLANDALSDSAALSILSSVSTLAGVALGFYFGGGGPADRR